MVGVALVSVVEAIDVAMVADSVVGTAEEGNEVGCWFEDLGQPNHCRPVSVLALKMGAAEFDMVGAGLFSSLYKQKQVNIKTF